ncbi:MAG: hypothetical protein MI723_01370, partial [Caulobacterales bacterium]|nr:hypothetical protein [Caulobacterales bacterium]
NIDLHADIQDGVGPLLTLDRGANVTSCSGEIVVSAVWRVNPNVAFRFGYQGLWLGEQELRIRHFHKTLEDYLEGVFGSPDAEKDE